MLFFHHVADEVRSSPLFDAQAPSVHATSVAATRFLASFRFMWSGTPRSGTSRRSGQRVERSSSKGRDGIAPLRRGQGGAPGGKRGGVSGPKPPSRRVPPAANARRPRRSPPPPDRAAPRRSSPSGRAGTPPGSARGRAPSPPARSTP